MHNEILLGLPRKECDVLFPNLEYVQMRTHDALHEAGQPITHGYFVNDGLASVLNVMADGKSVEVGLAGKEGFIGLPLVVGLSTSPTRVVTQVAGSAFRIRASDFTAGTSPLSSIRKTTKSLRPCHDDAGHASRRVQSGA